MSIITLLGVIAILFVVIVALSLFIIVTFPVSKPYFLAVLSKSKYALLQISKNGTISIEPAQFRNSRAVVSNGLAKFIKQGLHGSYTLGTIRCDLVHSEVAPMIEDSTLGVFEQLESVGISDIQDLLTRVNRSIMLKLGLINREELTPAELENVKLARQYYLNNVTLLAPAVRELRVHDMIKNCVVSPASISADLEESTALVAKQYRAMVQGKKEAGLKGGEINIKLIAVIGVLVVLAGLALCFFMQ